MLDFILNNSVTLIFIAVVLLNVLDFLNEYFPFKARYSENLMERYMQYQLHLKYRKHYEKILDKR